MITTQQNNEVEILELSSETGQVYIKFEDGTKETCHISELKADGGMTEILNSIPEVV